ncbi:MAG: transglycosylase SLT domain-containing protein [Bacteroidota bacterium]
MTLARVLFSKKIFILLFLCWNAVFFLQANNVHPYNEQEVISRIKQMKDGAVEARYTSIVRAYLKRYLSYSRPGSEVILGRSIMYFPMFEEYLKESELPDDLKYLSVVESALRPKAVSRAGAVGLWQFMPATAREVGLSINKYVDERRDPEKSTKAAMKYLKQQYNRFGSWELALAAYNGGSGTVSRAIKRGRSKDFWRIRNYLPKETRNYVPAYIAACYLGKFYDEHELTPKYPDLDRQMVSSMTVYNYLAFSTIAKITGLSLEEIKFLNPAYKKNFIPNSSKGNTLRLPSRVFSNMEAYFEAKQPDSGAKINEATLIASLAADIPNKDLFYNKVTYLVKEGETIDSLAKVYKIKHQYIRAWNMMTYHQTLTAGQELLLYGVVLQEVQAPVEPIVVVEKIEEFEELPTTPIDEVEEEKILAPNTFERDEYLYYTVQPNENLSQIAEKLEEVSVRDIMILNNFRGTQIPRAGREIKVRKL